MRINKESKTGAREMQSTSTPDQILSHAQLYLVQTEPDTQIFLEAFNILAHARYGLILLKEG